MAEIPSSVSMKTKKRAGSRDLRPVRVKRERDDSNSVMDAGESRALSESDAVVKTEDMEVPCCKVEPTAAAGAFRYTYSCVMFLRRVLEVVGIERTKESDGWMEVGAVLLLNSERVVATRAWFRSLLSICSGC